jgi:hypothetical protein
MNLVSFIRAWAWALPWLAALLFYAAQGWLDPQYWTVAGASPNPPLAQAPALTNATPATSRPGIARERAPLRPPPPWPDERGIRQQLLWHGLRPLAFNLGPQRQGATEVRVTLQWQGPLAAGLIMLQTLATDWPQMSAETLVLQYQAINDWRIEWRGQWRHWTAPAPLPEHPSTKIDWPQWAASRVFDAGGFGRYQSQLWATGLGSSRVLRLLRPEQLEVVALVRSPQPQAWVQWQQHTLVLKVGDRVGEEGDVVHAIDPSEVVIGQRGRWHRLRPRRPTIDPAGAQP